MAKGKVHPTVVCRSKRLETTQMAHELGLSRHREDTVNATQPVGQQESSLGTDKDK